MTNRVAKQGTHLDGARFGSARGKRGNQRPYLPARAQSLLLFASVGLFALTAPKAISELQRGLAGPWLGRHLSEAGRAETQFDLQPRSKVQSAGSARAPGLYADAPSVDGEALDVGEIRRHGDEQ